MPGGGGGGEDECTVEALTCGLTYNGPLLKQRKVCVCTHSSPLSAHLLLLGLGGESRHVVDDGGHVGRAVQLHLADAVLVGLQHPLDTCHPTSITVVCCISALCVCVCVCVCMCV